MVGLYILVGIFLLVTAISFVRVGISAKYGSEGAEVWISILFYNARIYPAPEKEIAEPVKKAVKEKKVEDKRDGGTLEKFKFYLDLGIKTLGKFIRAIRIDILDVTFTAADGGNPACAAIMYGSAYAAEGIILGVLENNILIKRKNIDIRLSYSDPSPTIYCEIKLSSSIGRLISVGSSVLLSIVVNLLKMKVGAKNG